ncbi:hypothetical protein GCK32_000671, partial [Trichostrongylus colubriformis]
SVSIKRSQVVIQEDMELYEPIGDQKNVVDAPKTGRKEKPMMPPMQKSKPRAKESVKPLRSGDDIDLVSDTGLDIPPKPCKAKNSSNTTKKNEKKKQRPSGGKSSNSSRRSNKSQTFFIIAVVISILLCLLFLALAVLGLLHLFDTMTAIRPFMPLQC